LAWGEVQIVREHIPFLLGQRCHLFASAHFCTPSAGPKDS
jgi:hypothetical protein